MKAAECLVIGSVANDDEVILPHRVVRVFYGDTLLRRGLPRCVEPFGGLLYVFDSLFSPVTQADV